jgi:hypothetical protein
MSSRIFSFSGGMDGPWRVVSGAAVTGEPLGPVARVDVVNAYLPPPSGEAGWILRGAASNERYVTRPEHDMLAAAQPPLGRPEATRAALIPITKSAAWWLLCQDERRAILEERSHHIAIGARYLPAIARKLHHSRDLGEPFDFLTWFEYSPPDAGAFDDLVGALRATEEWSFVEREVDVRLVWDAAVRG